MYTNIQHQTCENFYSRDIILILQFSADAKDIILVESRMDWLQKRVWPDDLQASTWLIVSVSDISFHLNLSRFPVLGQMVPVDLEFVLMPYAK